MDPISEADTRVRGEVEAITGPCRCREKYRRHWAGHADDRRDPGCLYHQIGEQIANLVRDNLRLKNKIAGVDRDPVARYLLDDV